MPVSGSMNASNATHFSNPKKAIAAYSAPTAMCHARLFRKEKAEVFGQS